MHVYEYEVKMAIYKIGYLQFAKMSKKQPD